jgi:YHS domain-containing protein
MGDHRGRRLQHAAAAVDPVCNMTGSIEDASETAHAGGVLYYFCGGCRRRFQPESARYLVEVKHT